MILPDATLRTHPQEGVQSTAYFVYGCAGRPGLGIKCLLQSLSVLFFFLNFISRQSLSLNPELINSSSLADQQPQGISDLYFPNTEVIIYNYILRFLCG